MKTEYNNKILLLLTVKHGEVKHLIIWRKHWTNARNGSNPPNGWLICKSRKDHTRSNVEYNEHHLNENGDSYLNLNDFRWGNNMRMNNSFIDHKLNPKLYYTIQKAIHQHVDYAITNRKKLGWYWIWQPHEMVHFSNE